MKTKNKKVIVALSGGVDSSVACALLLKQGYEVEAVFMKNWTPRSEAEGLLMCPLQADEKDARVVASQLGLKFSTVSFEKEYRSQVVDYLFKEYQEGRTPNPDILCNSRIKFRAFLDYALKRGADFVATGHYVRKNQIKRTKNQTNQKSKIKNSPRQARDGAKFEIESKFEIQNSKLINHQLLKGMDSNKDQSYFLYQITQEQLSKCLFPIGEYEKAEVRKLAKKYGLITHAKKDSQGICFVGEVEMKAFLKQKIKSKKGDIITTDNKKIGEHEGVWYYTIGQRRGIGVGGGMPYYVVDKDLKNNVLLVARGDKDEALFKQELMADEVHWIAGVEPKFPLKCKAKIRYRQKDQECIVNKSQISNYKSQINPKFKIKNQKIMIKFTEKQRAITPGQFIALYQKDVCLGGGKIL
ncbi:tRNA 2-thiouridine(34) synthase MnmA [Patescibacteria group bacterium]|nr:tRNA 2-thiouridine(34) synthase MnmA [Patescibacteria group bacterium]